MKELLNIVDDTDAIISTRSREEIHRLGLLHREIHVYFVTPARELIFQHRAKDKDTFPDVLDATVGGHVEIGDTYEETAIKETAEETGIRLRPSDLIFISKGRKFAIDPGSGRVNNVFNTRYLYIYRGRLDQLKVEAGKAVGFEAWPLERFENLSDAQKRKFSPHILDYVTSEFIEFLKKKHLP